jgi:hypothetical protein
VLRFVIVIERSDAAPVSNAIAVALAGPGSETLLRDLLFVVVLCSSSEEAAGADAIAEEARLLTLNIAAIGGAACRGVSFCFSSSIPSNCSFDSPDMMLIFYSG